MDELTDTTCIECGGDCVLDEEYMTGHYPVPEEVPSEDRMWACVRCNMRYTNSMMLAFQKERRQ